MPRRQPREPRKRPTVVLFVRHGTTPTTGKELPGQGRGLHLSDAGRAQAEQVAARIGELQPGTVTAVYASMLERAGETAAEIAKVLGLEVHVDPDLADCDTGDWTGKELKELSKLPEWRQMRRWPSGFRFPGGESAWQVSARVAAVIERLRTSHEGQTVVAVSHADPIKLAVAMALGAPPDFNDRVMVSTCSVTAISYGSDGATVLAANSTGDLRALGLAPPPEPAPAGDGAGPNGGEAAEDGTVR